VIQIQESVGRNGVNRFQDVATIQTLLNDCLHLLAPQTALEPDGVLRADTVAAIEEFQRRVLHAAQPDGRVDPGGRTLLALLEHRREEEGPTLDAVIDLGSSARFPLEFRPAESYREGMRRFGARRSGGRKHAGCDLYAPLGTPIFAMDSGVVVQDLYHFYLGTFALEIQHPGFVARYGEITGKVPDGLRRGATVRRGDLLGSVGRLEGLDMTMLHLELYAGSGSGPLTVRANIPFQRRSDLVDPTPVLDAAVDE